MKALLVGANGQLANSIRRAAPQNVEILAFDRAQLDICDADAVRALLTREKPDLVFNGAAYNAVDRAETDGAPQALQINAWGAANLALSCRDCEARLAHFSTDFVFDGTKNSPYSETDATRPLSVYGASKLCGENIVTSSSPRHLAIRVCRLFGPVPTQNGSGAAKPGGNFPLLMRRLGRERDKVRVVNDQIGSPTYTPDLARAVWELVEKSDGGLFHLSNAGEVSFADYAAAVFEMDGSNCQIERVSSADYGASAARPLYSTLSNAKAHSVGVAPLRDWREALRDYLDSSEI